MLDRFVRWFWGRVGYSVAVPDESLRAFRTIFGLFMLLFHAPYFAWIDRSPHALFNPPVFSPANLLSGFPPSPFFVVLDIVGVVALCFMIVGRAARLSTLVLLIVRVLGDNFAYSFGKIDHDIIVNLVLLCMVIAAWGDGRASTDELDPGPIEGTSRRSLRGVSLLAVCLAFGFLTAGLVKAPHWINLDTSRSGMLSWYYPNLFALGRSRMLAGWVPGLPLAFVKLLDIVAVLLELAGLVVVLVGRVSWRVWLFFAALMHLANLLFLNIDFSIQAIAYLAFIDLAFLAPRIDRARIPLRAIVIGLGVWQVVTRLISHGADSPVIDAQATGAQLYVGVIVTLAVATMIAIDVRREFIHRRRGLGSVRSGVPVRALVDEPS